MAGGIPGDRLKVNIHEGNVDLLTSIYYQPKGVVQFLTLDTVIWMVEWLVCSPINSTPRASAIPIADFFIFYLALQGEHVSS